MLVHFRNAKETAQLGIAVSFKDIQSQQLTGLTLGKVAQYGLVVTAERIKEFARIGLIALPCLRFHLR